MKETKRKVEYLGITECCQLDLMSSCVRNDTVHILPRGFHWRRRDRGRLYNNGIQRTVQQREENLKI